MTETNLDMTETINENSEQVNAITEAGELKMLGATSALRMALTVDQTTAVIQRLEGGSDALNLSFITATASDIISGKVGADASGNPVYGSIATVKATLSGNVVTVPAGCIVTAQTLTVAEMAEPTVSGNAVTIPVGYNKTAKTVTIQSVGELTVSGNVVTIPAGYNPTQQTVTIPEAGALTVSGNKVTVPVGYITVERTAEIPAVSATLSDNKVTIPAGYNNGQTLTVAEAPAPSLSGNVVTLSKGYNATENKVTVGTARESTTITPSAEWKQIPADTYCTGAQYIAGDENLVPENIAEGVSIFGVEGTHSGGGTVVGGMDFYKCAAVYGPRNVTRIRVENAGTSIVNGDYEKTDITNDSGGEVWKHLTADCYYYKYYEYWCINQDYNTYGDSALYYSWDGTSWNTGYSYDTGGQTGAEPVPTTSKIQVTLDADVPKTWDGYKAVLTDGVYSISEELTQGLSWTLMRPEVKSIYSADALIKVSSMHGIDSSMIFHARLASLTDTADTWQKLTYTGSPQVSTVDGIACLRFSSGQGIQTSEKIGISGNAPRTISMWALPENDVPDYPTAVFWGDDNANGSTRVLFGPKKNGDNMRLMFGGWNNDADFSSNIPVGNKLHHCALVYNGEKLLLYIDGQSSSNNGVSGLNTTDSKLSIGYASVVSGYSFKGYIADVKVYNRALEETEILELFQNPPSGDTPRS